MHPVLVDFHGFYLTSYSFFFGLAATVAILLWAYLAARRSFAPEQIMLTAFITLLVAWFGARGFFVLSNWQHFREGTFSLWHLWEGGIVFYGGFLGGGAFLFWRFKVLGWNAVQAFSSLVPAVAIGHAIGRVGCFLNGCCHGGPCAYPWGVIYSHPLSAARPLNQALHPTQLYEVIALIFIAVLLLGAELKGRGYIKHPNLSTLRLYLIAYPTLRFVIEYFRADPYRGAWLGLSSSQWVSLALFAAALLLDLRAKGYHNREHENRS